MNLENVQNDLGDALETISGLRVFRYPTQELVPPAAIVGFPEEILFEETYQQGMARYTIPIFIVEGAVSDRASVMRLYQYGAGAGDRSVKAAIDGYSMYTALDVATVISAEFDAFTMGNVDYIAAIFEVDTIGQGQ